MSAAHGTRSTTCSPALSAQRCTAERTPSSGGDASRAGVGKPVEHGVAPWREPIPHLEADRQAELLQLPHIGLEWEALSAELRGEVGGADAGLIADCLEHRARPRAMTACAIEPLQPPRDCRQLLSERNRVAQGDPWIRAE